MKSALVDLTNYSIFLLDTPSELDKEGQGNREKTAKQTDKTGCRCGSKIKSRQKFACEPSLGERSRCPCVIRGQQCSLENCKCRNCGNMDKKTKNVTRCRCGEGQKKEDGVVSCMDAKGKNRTRCPCFVNGFGCEGCSCYNCRNTFGENQKNKEIKNGNGIRKRKSMLSSPPSLKRIRGTQFLRENGVANFHEGWSQLEGCILEMTESFLFSATCLSPSNEHICTLYNYVIESNAAKDLGVKFNKKKLQQISGKLEYKRKRLETLLRIISRDEPSSSE